MKLTTFQVTLPPGQEPELPSMIIECCSQEKTYSKFYGLIGERFAKLNRLWADLFEAAFAKYYDTIHRYETNRLRNIARFFGHMLSSDAIGWHVLSVVHLNEEETTSSSRIFIKILFQDLAEVLGMPKLQGRLNDPILKQSYEGLFPKDNPRNTRFSINYFTSIGMGVLTEDMREHLKNLPKPTIPALPAPASTSGSESGGSVSSYSSYTGSSRTYSRSRSPSRTRGRDRARSHSRSPLRSIPQRTRRDRSISVMSRSSYPPPPRHRRNTSSPLSSEKGRSRSYSTSPRRAPPPARRQRRSSSVSRADDEYHSRPPVPRRRSPSYSPRRDRRGDERYEARPRRSFSHSITPPHKRAGGGRRYSPSRSRSRSSPRPLRSFTRDNDRRNGRNPGRHDSRSLSPRHDSRRRRHPSSTPSRSLPRRNHPPPEPDERNRRRARYSLSQSRSVSPSRSRSPSPIKRRANPRASPRYDHHDARDHTRARHDDRDRDIRLGGGKRNTNRGPGRARAADYL